jgi:hypothetical protein
MAGLMPRARSKDMSDEVYEADLHRRMRQQSLRLEMNRSNNPDETSCKMELARLGPTFFAEGSTCLARQLLPNKYNLRCQDRTCTKSLDSGISSQTPLRKMRLGVAPYDLVPTKLSRMRTRTLWLPLPGTTGLAFDSPAHELC